MGLRAAITVCVTSFLLGSLFTHWIADSLTLWKSPITDDHLWTAAAYYSILANASLYFYYFLLAIAILGGTAILWSLRDGNAGNLMFDGGSIFLYCTSVAMYLHSVIPSIFTRFASLPEHSKNDPFPRALQESTLDLATSNLICSVCLTGVLALQAGRLWAERYDESDNDISDSQKTTNDTPKTSEKSQR